MCRVASVALLTPLPQLDRVLEYAVPESLRADIAPGVRVRAPLKTGGRLVDGFVLSLAHESAYEGKLAELSEVVSPVPVLTPDIAELARAVANRQAGTLNDVLRLAIPARSARLEGEWWAARCRGERPETGGVVPARAASQHLGDAETRTRTAAASSLAGDPDERIFVWAPHGVLPHGVPRALALLLDAACDDLTRGQSAIVAVPDFRDVELAMRYLRERVDERLVKRMDARLKPKERYRQFLGCLEDTPVIALGTRAALFAPVPQLGSIYMWDEADDSFEEPLAPYSHARDVALQRQQLAGCRLVFAAHVPSPHIVRLLELGWLRARDLRQGRSPRVIISESVLGEDERSRMARIPSYAWQRAREALEKGNVLMQVARAGYAPALVCEGCGERATCRSCGTTLVQPHRGALPRCRVCGRDHDRWSCQHCGSEHLRASGHGVHRTVEELGRAFPGATLVVADGEHERITIAGRGHLVVATRGAEPIAEGGYACVILLDTASLLLREGLDVVIDAVRGWTSAAALCADDGEIVLVGHEHPATLAVRDHRELELVRDELADRRTLHFPPAVRVAEVRGSKQEVDAALERLREHHTLDVLGPVPDEEGKMRALVRMGYSEANKLVPLMKAELVRAATSRPTSLPGKRRPLASTLRIRLDPPDAF